MFVDLVVEATVSVLRESREVPDIVAARRRDEIWFQRQIYSRLIEIFPQYLFETERYYPAPNDRDRCDLWYRKNSDHESWVELKLCVTNYVSDYSYGHSQSPPRQLEEVRYDIKKLRRLPATASERHILLLAYPMPPDYATHGRWPNYLALIREESSHISEVLAVAIERMGKKAHVVGYRIDV